jgi:outer membrane immunogenic protein
MDGSMLKILSVALSAMAVAAPAFAADLAVKAPVSILTAAGQFSWTGCHIGGHVGGVVSEDRTTSALGITRSFSSTGFIGGGQVGCDNQFASGWVVGVQARAAWSDLKNVHNGIVINRFTGVTSPSQFTFRNDFLASATARVGYSFADRWLGYIRGGAAWTDEKADETFTASFLGVAVDPSATTSRIGWTAGAGVDWAFAPHWSAGLEYDYYDFGSQGAKLVTPTNNVFVSVFSLKDTMHTVTASVDYHF